MYYRYLRLRASITNFILIFIFSLYCERRWEVTLSPVWWVLDSASVWFVLVWSSHGREYYVSPVIYRVRSVPVKIYRPNYSYVFL